MITMHLANMGTSFLCGLYYGEDGFGFGVTDRVPQARFRHSGMLFI